MTHPKTYIIIVNWNGWGDTIECLESIFRLNYSNYTVIVCDNDSSDGSFERIKSWANGYIDSWIKTDNPLRSMTYPPVNKPIPFIISESEIGIEGDYKEYDVPLVLIKNNRNLGFAGANNVGLRYVLNNDDFEYVWILNNDTVVHPGALHHLVDRMIDRVGSGICGSTLFFYYHTELMQCQGGSVYNKWLGVANHISANKLKEHLLSVAEVERQIDYVAGASMLISREFLLDIGLMSEDYFLYYEEIDWAVRSNKSYSLSYAEKSVVYHKEGASIGTSTVSKNRSAMSDYFITRNRFRFTFKFFPYALPTVFAGFVVTVINRIRRREWNKLLPVLTAALFFKKKYGRYTP